MSAIDSASVPKDVFTIAERLRAKGKRAWIVGGCVRDLLLGRAANDWDVATDARPEELLRDLSRAIPTGIEHGTVTVVQGGAALRGHDAARRGDLHRRAAPRLGRVRGRHHGQDLARRDFTVNAIALDPVDGAIIDPFGGRGDLRARRAPRGRQSARALLRGRPARPARGALRGHARARRSTRPPRRPSRPRSTPSARWRPSACATSGSRR